MERFANALHSLPSTIAENVGVSFIADPVWRNLPKNDAVKIEEEDDLDLKEISEYLYY